MPASVAVPAAVVVLIARVDSVVLAAVGFARMELTASVAVDSATTGWVAPQEMHFRPLFPLGAAAAPALPRASMLARHSYPAVTKRRDQALHLVVAPLVLQHFDHSGEPSTRVMIADQSAPWQKNLARAMAKMLAQLDVAVAPGLSGSPMVSMEQKAVAAETSSSTRVETPVVTGSMPKYFSAVSRVM